MFRLSRAVGIRSLAQRGAMSVEVGIWIGSGVLAILGLVQAVHSVQHLLWLAIWPARLHFSPRSSSSGVRDIISVTGCWSLAGEPVIKSLA
jgi:hypothetical protein